MPPNPAALGRIAQLKKDLEAAKSAYDAWGAARMEGEAIARGVKLGSEVARLQAAVTEAEAAAGVASSAAGGAGALATEGEVAAAEALGAGAAGDVALPVVAAASETALPAVVAAAPPAAVGTAGGATFLGLTPVGWVIVAVVALAVGGGIIYTVTRRSSTGATKTTQITTPGGGHTPGNPTGGGLMLSYLAPSNVVENTTSTIEAVGSHFFPSNGIYLTVFHAGDHSGVIYGFEPTLKWVSDAEVDITAMWTLHPGKYDVLVAESPTSSSVVDSNFCSGCLTVRRPSSTSVASRARVSLSRAQCSTCPAPVSSRPGAGRRSRRRSRPRGSRRCPRSGG